MSASWAPGSALGRECARELHPASRPDSELVLCLHTLSRNMDPARHRPPSHLNLLCMRTRQRVVVALDDHGVVALGDRDAVQGGLHVLIDPERPREDSPLGSRRERFNHGPSSASAPSAKGRVATGGDLVPGKDDNRSSMPAARFSLALHATRRVRCMCALTGALSPADHRCGGVARVCTTPWRLHSGAMRNRLRLRALTH